ncbi:MAG: hypothetical protein AB1553_02080 [Nitrospirota bacterium]
MAIQASDIKVYGSASMPDDDAATNIGGAINTGIKVEFTDIAPAGQVEMFSSSAADTTQQVTITGRNAAGEIVTETKNLNGTTVVAFTTTFERILKIVMSAVAVGTITVRESVGAEVLITIEPGITQVRKVFYNAVAPSEGSIDFYEKIFFKNTHASLTLTEAKISEYADPSGKITFALENALDGTDTNGVGNNRYVAPAGYTFNNTEKNVANSGNHTAEKAQGVWLKLTLTSTDEPTKTTYTLRESGVTI